jgi:hypothetical protein
LTRQADGLGQWDGAKSWAIQQTCRGIGKRFHHQWSRLLGSADPDVVTIHRKVFWATFGYTINPLLFAPELYR